MKIVGANSAGIDYGYGEVLIMELFDRTAAADTSVSVNGQQTFARPELLTDGVVGTDYATFEKNLFVLDGAKTIMSDVGATDCSYWSDRMTGSTGRFAVTPAVVLTMVEQHSSVGITLHFKDAYPKEIRVLWYDRFGNIIDENNYNPDGLDYFCKNKIKDFTKVRIEFLEYDPGRYAKLQGVEYGTQIMWMEDEILSMSGNVAVDETGNTLSAGKLTANVIDTGDELNPGNPGGVHAFMQVWMEARLYRGMGQEKEFKGKWFYQEAPVTKGKASMKFSDYIGLLDTATFDKGTVYKGVMAGPIIAAIMTSAGIDLSMVEVDIETSAALVSGTIKPGTCREALREVLFATGAIAVTDGQEKLIIRQDVPVTRGTIPRSRKFSTTMSVAPYISEVMISYDEYLLDAERSQISLETYEAGTHKIIFTDPAVEVQVSAGTIKETAPYYIVLEVPETQEIEITGRKYTGNSITVSESVEKLEAGMTSNRIEFSGTLFDFATAKKKARALLDVYQYQTLLTVKFISEDELCGDWYTVENPQNDMASFISRVTNVTTDIARGFVKTAKMRGKYNLQAEKIYSGELLTGEEVSVL